MRIACPHCGERDIREFSYFGAAGVTRPDPAEPNARERFADYVYQRDNPAGPHRELWYHGMGCQAWLAVTRDTRTHQVLGVDSLKTRTLAGERGGAAL